MKVTSTNLSSRLREAILESAKKKLEALGFEKTTMQGIARELTVSKATVYYYFADREALFLEVITREEEKYFRTLELRMKHLEDPEAKLAGVVQLMNDFCREFTSLTRLRLYGQSKLRPGFGDRFGAFHDRELHLVQRIIDEAMTAGTFRRQNPAESAGIFLDILRGLRLLDETTNEGHTVLEKKQKLFLRIFMDNLRK